MWIKPQTKQTFLTYSDIRGAFSNVSFPSVMSDNDIASVGLLPVTQTPQPTFDRRVKRVEEVTPILDNVWKQQWQVVDLSAQEKEAMALQIKQEIIDGTQKRLNDFASTRYYDGVLSLCTYATSPNPKFQAEGQYGVEARDTTWATLYEIMEEVQAGTRPMPSGYSEIESELPVLQWPN
jgi:hypothetical protein